MLLSIGFVDLNSNSQVFHLLNVGEFGETVKSTTNKAFKSDSQRLAVSLRSSLAKRRSHLNAAL
ncbi:hypothetical protein D8X77_22260 [Vibrio vulnificus]|nr:hypothetical protein [Vibrio vulnificus]